MTAGTAWIVYACRTPYTVEVAEIIWRRGERVSALVDNLDAPGYGANEGACDPISAIEAPVLRSADLRDEHFAMSASIPLITPGHRFAVVREMRSAGFEAFSPLVDPSALIARTAVLGEGAVVNAATVIAGASTLGRFVHVNRSASVGHHNEISDFVTLGPGCVLAGHVRIGRGAFVGAGAVFAPKAVGPNAIVGAGAVVVSDVPPWAVVVGNPARVIRTGDAGYGGVSVPG